MISFHVRRAHARLVALLTALGVAGAVLAGCGSTPVAVAPASYGIPGHCYYIDDPSEALALVAAGLCPAGWVPTLAPDDWIATYWTYYSSPVYQNTYVPQRLRVTYRTHVDTWHTTHITLINRDSTRGTWRYSNGKTKAGGQAPSTFASPKVSSVRTTSSSRPGARSSSSSRPAVVKVRTTSRSTSRSSSRSTSRSSSSRRK